MAGLRRHWPILVLLLLGAAIRAVVIEGFRPILWFLGDSIGYLGYTVGYPPVPYRPAGYSFFLFLLKPFHQLALIAVVQHGLGLCIAVLIYALCLRLGVRRWVATLAAVPVIFDAWEITSEQYLLSETLFIAVLLVAFLLALWWPVDRRPPIWAVAVSGLLFGASVVVRTEAEVLVVPLFLLLVARRAGILRIVVALAMFAAPLVAYAGYFDTQFGWFGLSETGRIAYGRVATFADCKGVSLTPDERRMCPTPAQHRIGEVRGHEYFWWDVTSPYNTFPGTIRHRNAVGEAFAIKIIEHQPGQYASGVWDGIRSEFSVTRNPSVYDVTPTYVLPSDVELYANRYQPGSSGVTHPNPTIERWFRSYQRHVFVPGIVFLIGLVVSAAGALFGRRGHRSGQRSAVMGLSLASALLLVVTPVTAYFNYRYLIPALPLLSVSTAVGATVLVGRIKRRPGAAPSRVPQHLARGRRPEREQAGVALPG